MNTFSKRIHSLRKSTAVSNMMSLNFEETTYKKNCTEKTFVKGISLSRNFGQHYAITAGLDAAKGDWVIVMDGDLQDQPEEIPNLYKKALEGYDIVCARRTNGCYNFLFINSKIAYGMVNFISS